MTTMIVSDLGRIPMSPYLTATLTRAADYAAAQSHREVTLEHLLLALAEDPEATIVLKSSNVDLARMTTDVSDFLGRSDDRIDPASSGHTASISADLRRILEAAAAAARQGRRREINGAIVLAAIVGDGKTAAANILRAQGLTFEEAIRALQRASALPPPPAPQPPPDSFPAPVPVPPPVAAPAPIPAPQPQPLPNFGATPPPDPSRQASTEEILASARERLQQRQEPDAVAVPSPGPALPRANYPDLGGPPVRPAPPSPLPYAFDDQVPRTAGRMAETERPPPPLGAERPGAPPDDARTQWSRPPQPMPPPETPYAPAPAPPPAPAPVAVPPRFEPYPGAAHPSQLGPPTARTPATEPTPHHPAPATERRRPAHAGPFGSSVPLIETGQLVENIPRRMRAGIPMVVEARIARAQVKDLAKGLESGGGAFRHEIVVTKAMSVRLRAPHGGFSIENRSPETQWIDNVLGIGADDFASWRWTITPHARGKRQLQLIVSARTVGADGMTAETALPDQMVDVKVTINYGRTIKKWLGWVAAAVIGGLLAKFGEMGWVIAKLMLDKHLGG